MKKLILLFLSALVGAHAASTSSGSYAVQPFTVAGANYDVAFGVGWWADDYPLNSAPGRLELFDGSGNLLGRVVASNYQGTGVSISVSGNGTVDGVSSAVGRYTAAGTPADGYVSGTWHLTSLAPGTYTLRLWSYETHDTLLSATTVWTDTTFNGGSEPAGLNRPPAITWVSAPATAGHGQDYTVSAHGHDDDGNLTQVNVWKNGQPFAFGGGGNGTDADSANASNDAGPQTITFTAQAVDADGAASPVITQFMAISPPPVQYSLSTSASAGGSVSPGGWFNPGTSATLTAFPDASHDFAGWNGDAGGAANPFGILMDRNKAVQAVFVLKSYPLTTSAITGGSVTPGGVYPYGTTVILSAVPDSTHRFIGWAGDAGGSLPSIALTITAPKDVQAIFADKFAQTILFSPPGDQPVGGPAVALDGTSTSGLPVTYIVLSGPAALIGGNLQVTGPGTITLQATQAGDALYLPAAPVTQTFNVITAATLKYRASTRTLLQAGPTTGSAIYVLEKP